MTKDMLSNCKLKEQKNDGPFFRALFMLAMMVNDLQVSTVKLREVIGVLAKPTFVEFKIWLSLAEVYGSGYLDDVDYKKFNTRASQTHKEAFIIELERIVTAYDYAVLALDLQKKDSPIL